MSKVLTLNNKVLVTSNKTLSYEESYQNGDNMEWGSSELTNLAGTSWYFNETLYEPPDRNSGRFSLNFTANGNNYSTMEYSSMGTAQGVSIAVWYNATSVYTADAPDHWYWVDSAYRTISITGGADEQNQYIIAWIQSNATQVTS